MAERLGKTLNELLGWEGNLTHRQMMAWSLWEEERWFKMDLTHYYLMRIAQIVHNTQSKNQVGLEKMKIEFKQPPPSQRRVKPVYSKEVISAWSRAKWCMAVGLKPVKKEDGTNVS